MIHWLVVWNMNFIFHNNIWDVILPIDFHIFQDGSNHQPDVILICDDSFSTTVHDSYLFGGLEHEWIIFPYFSYNHPNWLSYIGVETTKRWLWFGWDDSQQSVHCFIAVQPIESEGIQVSWWLFPTLGLSRPTLLLVGGLEPFFVLHNIWDNPSHWPICFKIVKNTNQIIL